MTTVAAPKLLTPADLRDPAKYTRSVLPVFGPHTRKWVGPDKTEVEIKVTVADLPEICEISNKPWLERWTPGRMTVGHVVQGLGFPERMQAENVGFVIDYQILPLNGKPWIWASLCARADEGVVVGEYPFRSADFDPMERRITGVALLTQPAFLDQGVAHYQSSTISVAYVMRAEPMADEEKFTPEEEAQYAKVCRYMKVKYAKLAQYMDDPSSTNTGIPQLNPDPQPGNPPAHYSKSPEYAALAQDNLRLTIERELDGLANLDRIRFDRSVELPKLMAMEPEKRSEHVAYMKANYGRLPNAGGWIPVAPSNKLQPVEATAAEPLNATESHTAVAYAKADNSGVGYEVSYAAAVQRVIAERAKK